MWPEIKRAFRLFDGLAPDDVDINLVWMEDIMKKIGFILVYMFLVQSVTIAANGGQNIQLFMPDGQLKSHTVRVYVTEDISPAHKPRLLLIRSHAITKKAVDEAEKIEPVIVAPGQEWVQRVSGQEVRRTGTLLLFDLNGLDFNYKTMMRVMPVVSWTENDSEHIVVSSREVNLGNIVTAIVWTVLIVGILILLVIFLARRNSGKALNLLTGVDGHFSLSQTQVACWTVVMGSVVLGYSMLKFEVPEIPASLLVLMGASLTTGGIGFFQDEKKLKMVYQDISKAPRSLPNAADLLRAFTPGKTSELSLAKAQMLFWTLLLIVIFISKSILDGVIWDVPWPLVALMGFSQAGYLAPKLAPE